MPFLTPPTFSVGRLFNQTDGNLYIRDNMGTLFFSAGVLPVGIIVHWGLALSLIPGGWALCDGAGGTPDLRDRLVVGAGLVYALDQRGGRASMTPASHNPHLVTPPANHGQHSGSNAFAHNSSGTTIVGQGGSPGVLGQSLDHVNITSDQHTPHTGATADSGPHAHVAISLLPPYAALAAIQRLTNPFSFTTPRTWADGETPNAAHFNIELRDNPGYLLARVLAQGTILPWSGTAGNVPSGWALCNGQNGTVDLRDRFVLGAGATYAALATGGSLQVTIPAHAGHLVGQPAAHPAHAVNIPAHGSNGNMYAGGSSGSFLSNMNHIGGASDAHGAHTGMDLSQHAAHSPIDVVPPYYALAFIQLVGGSAPTPPKTWVDGEIVEAAELNTFLRDNELAIFAGQFPIGGIAMWRDGTPPAGFAFCNGLSGTPELRNRFVIGATGAYTIGQTGGTLSGTPNAHADHTGTNPQAHGNHAVSEPVQHGVQGFYTPGSFQFVSNIVDSFHLGTTLTAAHSHTGAGADSHSPHSPIDTTPSYHALYYVQRIS